MYTVQYRCLYREFWYDDIGPVDWAEAVNRLQHLWMANQGQRQLRIVDQYGGVVYSA